MVIRERVDKNGGMLERRLNELGLRQRDVQFLDWTPMFMDIVFDLEAVGKAQGFQGPIPPEIFEKMEQAKKPS